MFVFVYRLNIFSSWFYMEFIREKVYNNQWFANNNNTTYLKQLWSNIFHGMSYYYYKQSELRYMNWISEVFMIRSQKKLFQRPYYIAWRFRSIQKSILFFWCCRYGFLDTIYDRGQQVWVQTEMRRKKQVHFLCFYPLWNWKQGIY